jgi:signal transduction histidine kinase
MSSLESIYQKMSPNLEAADFTHLHPETADSEQQQRIGREVAHELNNILTIIRGYADRMLIKNRDNPALRPDLKMISDNVLRAEAVIRRATPPRPPRHFTAQPVA